MRQEFEDVVEKVIDETSAKLLSFQCTLAKLDSGFTIDGYDQHGKPYTDFSKAQFDVVNPVPVVNEQGQEIGYVSVFIGKNRVVEGEFSLNQNTPEAFDIVNKVREYWPHFVGVSTVDEGSNVAETFQVRAIALLDGPPMDERVLPVKDK